MNIIRYGGPMARTRKVGSPIGYSGSAAVSLTGFVSVWATTGASETITIPTQAGTFNAVVDWGDSSPLETITSSTGFVHTYTTAGDHTISISGTFPNIHLNNGAEKDKIKKVLNLGTVGWTNLSDAFYGCINLTEFTAGSTDTSAVSFMGRTFRGCSGLTSMNISSIDTTNVTKLEQTFYGCSGVTSLDLSSFNTASVSNMNSMARNCSALTSIVGVEDWDITGLNSTGDLTNFLTSGKMTTAQYDALLIKWEAQASGIPAMAAKFGASILTLGGAADAAKQSLINTYGWTIGDGVTP